MVERTHRQHTNMDTLDRIKMDIAERIEELKPVVEEIATLEAAYVALGGDTSTSSPEIKPAKKYKRTRSTTSGQPASQVTRQRYENLRRTRMKEVITLLLNEGKQDSFKMTDLQGLSTKWGIAQRNLKASVLQPMIDRGIVEFTNNYYRGSTGGRPSPIFKLVEIPEWVHSHTSTN